MRPDIKKRTRAFICRSKREIKANPQLFVIYLVLRILVVAILIAQLLNGDYDNVFLCILTLILFTIPSFIERRIKIDIPDTLEVIILLFIFAAEILGEISAYYVNVPGWDTLLHSTNGFLCAAIGIALIDILNRSNKLTFNMSPVFVALVAFCFSMTIGVLWEFFEFAIDMIFRKDMQKDTIVSLISSVTFDPAGRNIPIVVNDITKTVITSVKNGVVTDTVINGYLDIGLLDTMKDLIVNFIGATVFSIIGFFYIKYRGEGKRSIFIRRFIPSRIVENGPSNCPDLSDKQGEESTGQTKDEDSTISLQ